MILTHIVACSRNRVIGSQNKMPWHLPEDLKFFKDTTVNHIMIMGRKTYESIGAKPLPKRFHIVVTRQNILSEHAQVVYVKDLESGIELAKSLTGQWGEEVFIVGGGEIYAQSINLIDRSYLTLIDQDFDGDTLYPNIDEKKFRLISKVDRQDPIPFSFLKYERIK